jgi:hypothetical protein
MIWAPHVVLPPARIVTLKIEVAVNAEPVGVGILVLPKGLGVSEPSLTTIAIHHLMVEVQGLKEEYVGDLSDMRTRSRIEFIRIAWKTCEQQVLSSYESARERVDSP